MTKGKNKLFEAFINKHPADKAVYIIGMDIINLRNTATIKNNSIFPGKLERYSGRSCGARVRLLVLGMLISNVCYFILFYFILFFFIFFYFILFFFISFFFIFIFIFLF